MKKVSGRIHSYKLQDEGSEVDHEVLLAAAERYVEYLKRALKRRWPEAEVELSLVHSIREQPSLVGWDEASTQEANDIAYRVREEGAYWI